jgi:hypothetical protein
MNKFFNIYKFGDIWTVEEKDPRILTLYFNKNKKMHFQTKWFFLIAGKQERKEQTLFHIN